MADFLVFSGDLRILLGDALETSANRDGRIGVSSKVPLDATFWEPPPFQLLIADGTNGVEGNSRATFFARTEAGTVGLRIADSSSCC